MLSRRASAIGGFEQAKGTLQEVTQDEFSISLYAFTHYLVHSLFGLDPGRLVFITKKGV